MTDSRTTIEGLLRQATPVSFRAGGPSMHPTLRDGEIIRIRPMRKDDPRPGAILLYLETGRLGLHRAVRRDRRSCRVHLAADAAPRGGRWVSESDLLGVAESVVRAGRERRLDGALARFSGLARHAARPLLRLWLVWRPLRHAGTSSKAG